MDEGIFKGDICNRKGCMGIIDETEKKGCSCHINPPCSSCTEPRAFCPVCGWDGKEEQDKINNKVSNTIATPFKTQGPKPSIVKNEQCTLEIWFNPKNVPQHTHRHYEVVLASGNWPTESLLNICDNGTFNGGKHHFGGTCSHEGNKAFVCVYID
jgi:hypothetical protein